MKKIRSKIGVIALSGAMLLSAAACADTSQSSTSATDSKAVAGSTSDTLTLTSGMIDPGYTDRDLDGTWDASEAVNVALSDGGITITGTGARADGSTLTISEAGVYVLSGSLSDGRIYVNTPKTDKVQLVLAGVNIACSDGPAIWVAQTDKIFLTLVQGSENVVTDSAAYTLAEGEDEPNGAIYSKEDMTVNGSGSLTVNGRYCHGIISKDELTITGGDITVTAVSDGIRGKDSVAICGGTIVISSGGDGIKSNNTDKTGVGWVSIDGGELQITTEAGDGIQADTVLQITDGTIRIVTGGGSANAAQQGGNGFGWNYNTQTQEGASNNSAKGLKGGTAVFITGGTIDVDSLDDSIHANGTAAITGGTLTLATGDDGIHAEAQLLVEAGTITVTQSYEGLEGLPVIITGGQIAVTASDDGINAAGDNDSAANGQAAGPMAGVAADEEAYIQISGGYVVVDAGGDGIDANGMFYMEGGTVLVCGPVDSANGAIDAELGAEVTGGTIIAVGSSGMAMNFTGGTQAALMVNYPERQTSGTQLTLVDAGGNTIASFAPWKDYQSVVISTPDLAVGGNYTLYSGGSVEGADTYSFSTGSYTAGTQVEQITLEQIITTSGSAAFGPGQTGGDMNHGGMRGNQNNSSAPIGEMPTGEMPSGRESTGGVLPGAVPSGTAPGSETAAGTAAKEPQTMPYTTNASHL